MYGHVACPKRNDYFLVTAIHCFTISAFDYIWPNIMTEQKRKGYQGIRATEAFEYENTKKWFQLLLLLRTWRYN